MRSSVIIKYLALTYLTMLHANFNPTFARNPIVIDIDNPKFRKLVAAVPRFDFSPENDPNLLRLAKGAASELKALLRFSGYFRLVNEAAFSDIIGQSKLNRYNIIPGFPNINPADWRKIGIESLIQAKIIKLNGDKYRLELRTADIHRGVRILGKAYTFREAKSLNLYLKTYVDRLLQAYTGKPGIFSSKIVFIGRKHKYSDKQVYVCDVDGKNLVQITNSKFPHLSPSWSRDGQKILYTSYKRGNPDLYMYNLKTRRSTIVSADKGINSGGVFTKNSNLIAFTGSLKGNTEIYLKYIGQKYRMPFIKGHGIDVDPAFSPDNKWLAFVSGRFGNPHIFRAELSWSHDKKMVEVKSDKRLTYAGWYNATPAWSPDSKKIAFAGFDRDIGRFDIFLMNFDGTKLERLTIQSGDNESPTWSPNGQLMIFHSNRIKNSNRKGRSQLYIMNRDGSQQRIIYTGLYDAQTPKWGPNLLK